MKHIKSLLIWCVAIALTIIITQYTMNSGVKEELNEVKEELKKVQNEFSCIDYRLINMQDELKYMQYRDSMYAIYTLLPKSIIPRIQSVTRNYSYIDAVNEYASNQEYYNNLAKRLYYSR